MAKTAARRTVQSVDRAVRILELLSEQPEGLALKDLAARTRLAPQTLQSLLRTLQSHQLVVQEGRGLPYLLGPRVHELGRRWMSSRDLATMARQAVERLARDIGESVLLAELRGRTLVGMAEISPQRHLMVRAELESSDRMHTMATAKLLLAFLDDRRQAEVVSSLRFAKHGPNAPAGEAQLRRQLQTIRKKGYAVCLEEAAAGVAALAVPVRGETGEVAAALGTSLPLARFSPAAKRRLLRELRLAAGTIEAAWRGAPAQR